VFNLIPTINWLYIVIQIMLQTWTFVNQDLGMCWLEVLGVWIHMFLVYKVGVGLWSMCDYNFMLNVIMWFVANTIMLLYLCIQVYKVLYDWFTNFELFNFKVYVLVHCFTSTNFNYVKNEKLCSIIFSFIVAQPYYDVHQSHFFDAIVVCVFHASILTLYQ
jgi:hypothetical protein